MRKFYDIAVPHLGIEWDITLLLHTIRDIFIVWILWQLGYKGYINVLTLLLLSMFFEAGNGICYNADGSHAFFNPVDVLPALPVGFLTIGLLSGGFDWMMLLYLSVFYLLSVFLLFIANVLLGRKIIFGQGIRL